MDRNPIISVITICKNADRTLERTILSVRDQVGVKGQIQHIVVDGHSADDTLDIIKKHEHLKWISEHDEGISDAFNKGMNMANGDYLLYLNSDDYLADDNVLKDVIDFIQRRNHPDWVIGNVAMPSDRGLRVIRPSIPPWCWTLILRNRMPHPAVIIKKEIQKEVGGFNLHFKYAMDFDLWAMLCKRGVKTTYYRRTIAVFSPGGQSSALNESHMNERLLILNRIRNNKIKIVLGNLYEKIKKLDFFLWLK